MRDLAPGDHIAVKGVEFPVDSGEVLASVIERREATDMTELKGFFQSATWHQGAWAYPQPWYGTLQILGVTVATTDRTLYGWEDHWGVNGATFFFDMSPGVLIRARGVQVGERRIEATHLIYEH